MREYAHYQLSPEARHLARNATAHWTGKEEIKSSDPKATAAKVFEYDWSTEHQKIFDQVVKKDLADELKKRGRVFKVKKSMLTLQLGGSIRTPQDKWGICIPLEEGIKDHVAIYNPENKKYEEVPWRFGMVYTLQPSVTIGAIGCDITMMLLVFSPEGAGTNETQDTTKGMADSQ